MTVPAIARFAWYALSWLSLLGTGSALGAAGIGLTGEYFNNSDFTSLKLTRVDAGIDFNWGTGAPTNTMSGETFSVRWSGQLEPRFSESYSFYVTADDGARLWVNDRLVAAQTFASGGATEITGRASLQAGQLCNLVLEYVEGVGNAQVKLEWASASQKREVIPASQLYPSLGLPEQGSILVEHWRNVVGTNLEALTGAPNYPNRPDDREFRLSFECLQTNWADQYGTRVSGFIVPPTSGSYVFAVAGDDAVGLYLSADATAANKRLIASNTVPTGFRQYTNQPGQISGPIGLLGRQRYYVEMLHKEGFGNDHFSVAWQVPGSTNLVIIPAQALVPAGLDRAPPAQTNYLDTLCGSHPRLLASPERFEWLRRSVMANSIPQLTSWWTALSNSAVAILAQPVSVYSPDNRGTILSISRTVIDRVTKTGLAWRLTGNTNFAERAWAELQQVASTNFPDWHPAHFLDTAEMTHACALGYDWLYDYWTPARRDVLRTAIVKKGLNQALTLYTNNSSWVASSANNWNLVCNGGMILGALAVGAEEEAVAEYVLSKAVASASLVMRHYTTDNGGWYEGPGYWDYTTEYNTRLMAGLESALGSDFGLSDARAVWETGLVPLYLVGPAKVSFNFADAGAGNVRGSQLFWLARRFNRPEFSWYERNNASADVLDLLWYDTRGSDPQASGLPTDNAFRGPTGATPYFTADAVTMRTRWQDADATFLGFKAGEVGASHGHLDAGSFVLDALGVRWAHDLGSDDYALPGYFSTPQRWTYYRLRAEGHNTLVINPGTNADQTVGAKPPVVLYTGEPSGERSAVVADLTSAYGITKVWRGLQLFHNRRWALVQDELQAAAPATVWWFMHLNSGTTVALETNGAAAMLTQGSDRLWVSVLAGGGAFAVSNALPLASSPHPVGQNTNSGYQKLALRLANVTTQTVAVLMVPLKPGESPPTNLPVVVPLSQWGAGSTNVVVVATNTPPTVAWTNLAAAPGRAIEVDLRSLAQDLETAGTNLLFRVANPTNGSVVLLADGHTARFTPPPTFFGSASFQFAVTDTWPEPRLVAHYDFELPDAALAGYVSDRSGHGFFGQLTAVGTGTNALDPDTPAVLAPHDGRSLWLRESGDFNGARLAVPISPADLDFNDQDWTVAGWFKRATSTNDDFVFYLGNSDGFGSPDELQVYCPSDQSSLAVRHYIATSTTDVDLAVPNVRVGEWHHVAVSFHSTNANSGTIGMFLDGAPVGNDPAATLNLPTGSGCYFGGHASSSFAVTRWFNGRLDDLAVFHGALTPAEVAQLASRPVAHFGGTTVTNTVFLEVLPARPALSALVWDSAQVRLRIDGVAGYEYTIEGSTNLLDWSVLLTTNAPVLPWEWADSAAFQFRQRFYRVLLRP